MSSVKMERARVYFPSMVKTKKQKTLVVLYVKRIFNVVLCVWSVSSSSLADRTITIYRMLMWGKKTKKNHCMYIFNTVVHILVRFTKNTRIITHTQVFTQREIQRGYTQRKWPQILGSFMNLHARTKFEYCGSQRET